MDKSMGSGDRVGDAITWVQSGARQREQELKDSLNLFTELEQRRFKNVIERLEVLEAAIRDIHQLLLKRT